MTILSLSAWNLAIRARREKRKVSCFCLQCLLLQKERGIANSIKSHINICFILCIISFVDKKTSQINPTNASSRNLWVSGLSSSTRATDLKQIFSKYGKVIGAKVVTNARTPGARCYGYVTMSSSEDAAKCIQHLHRTELHGRVISVEKVN